VRAVSALEKYISNMTLFSAEKADTGGYRLFIEQFGFSRQSQWPSSSMRNSVVSKLRGASRYKSNAFSVWYEAHW